MLKGGLKSFHLKDAGGRGQLCAPAHPAEDRGWAAHRELCDEPAPPAHPELPVAKGKVSQ